jgi:uncharacterized protein YlzI (FlbEa/FlbD family)
MASQNSLLPIITDAKDDIVRVHERITAFRQEILNATEVLGQGEADHAASVTNTLLPIITDTKGDVQKVHEKITEFRQDVLNATEESGQLEELTKSWTLTVEWRINLRTTLTKSGEIWRNMFNCFTESPICCNNLGQEVHRRTAAKPSDFTRGRPPGGRSECLPKYEHIDVMGVEQVRVWKLLGRHYGRKS